jgi:hypothetical protein
MLAFVLAASTLAHPPAVAMAAVSYRIWTDPSGPIVGQATAIYVATVWPASHSPDANSEPMPMEDFPWDFVVDSPSGARTKVELTHDKAEGNLWSGDFVFQEPGSWVVGLDPRHLGTPIDSTLGARVAILVLANKPGGIDPVAAVVVAGVALALIGVAIVLNRRRAN